MATPVPQVAALVLGLLLSSERAFQAPAQAEVSASRLDVFDARDVRSFASGRLRRGDRVMILQAFEDGWLMISPPPDCFSWIEQRALAPIEPGGFVRVTTQGALVRSGRLGAKLPGPPKTELAGGALVRLVDLPPLIVGESASARSWMAIEPPAGDRRYIRAEGVRLLPAEAAASEVTRTSFEGMEAHAEGIPDELRTALAQIEAMHRAAIRGPMEQWRLGTVRSRYESLLKQAADPVSSQAIRARLDLVARHEEMAEDARTIATVLQRSRERDATLARIEKRLATAGRPGRRPFTAEGMVQSSSRMVEGRRVLALIGPEGTPLAYLDVPEGLDARPMLARRVGVRGDVHYSDELRSRLITNVTAIEPLEEGR